ncbi:CDP-diacylglycerol--glycerol-3-phosphate 3-phosphatidyltransferase [Terrihabitans soli]|uniref:CDP-diacylglycerol--glycerol-3-phosphate 3-phosphatidyltransferase n=1 Tax=Terrihabitans soli TaxID=708113 RepID=A0A6S6QPF6_9HYPH|nr:CDP-alcohol phosphatidyltransferase family protein [Terrihabitans soli]BCJ90869.1 CDP-diacylglycerol--glycerol-3-phosphate 3-phosphatidyltransferase [Terrihabitans soli]
MPINLPNLITVLRLFAVPIVIWTILAGYPQAAFWIFLAAGISDGIDGYLARRWNQRTELGAYLDAIADKALLVSIFITLAIVQLIPVWLAIAVVSRDLMIVGAVILSWLMDHPVTIKPLYISKLNTVAQIGFAAAALGLVGFGLQGAEWLLIGGYVTGILTVLSALAYLAAWMRHMGEPRSTV